MAVGFASSIAGSGPVGLSQSVSEPVVSLNARWGNVPSGKGGGL
jgi:hypothetical protein